jgi:23S rRNA pseudouridine2457 synthase
MEFSNEQATLYEQSIQHHDHRYFIINKPYKMVSQFKSSHRVGLLCDLDFNFPEGTHAVGRLDNHSEGLLILTTNKRVTRLLFESEVPHARVYLVQVKHVVSPQTLELLRTGVSIRVKGGGDYITAPCEADVVDNPHDYFKDDRQPKEYAPSTWLLLKLTEGKYHQVRKMVAAVGHQCKRLIRVSIEDVLLGDLQPGGVREMDEKLFFEQLRIDHAE